MNTLAHNKRHSKPTVILPPLSTVPTAARRCPHNFNAMRDVLESAHSGVTFVACETGGIY